MSTAQTTTALSELRASHGVRLVGDAEEGYASVHLPNGVYGFTYAPHEAAIPLFSRKAWHSFELHKLPDGSQHLLGFVTGRDKEALASGFHVEITIYPDPWEDAVELVSVPLARVVPSKRGPSREGGNGLKVELL